MKSKKGSWLVWKDGETIPSIRIRSMESKWKETKGTIRRGLSIRK